MTRKRRKRQQSKKPKEVQRKATDAQGRYPLNVSTGPTVTVEGTDIVIKP